ncbi:hypothetical protein BJL95_16955 [Methylomonas sp. LWB]|uniref:ATP-binding cassette domain-containing protein n=1 Tax=Methylomonas sp. LWB TaxID=1905845 RepID=UPI0008D9BC23|nr:ATP-binding cassette domain-containing protein [Methylomonas sp. LWB]OHX34363.1 hypothetical protein BJL95_16955 [Methylomonas sp. LWB]
MSEHVLKLIDISIAYGSSIVIEPLTLKIKKGEFIGLVGSNGSGKTSLLKSIAGEINPHTGKIFLNNNEVTSLSIKERIENGIVYIHQFPIVFPELFVWENFFIWYSLIKTNNNSGLERHEVINQLQEKLLNLGLEIPLNKRVGELSESEQQILEFTRVFLSEPKLILIDEATSVLDFNLSRKILSFLKGFCLNGGVVIFVTHRTSELINIADKVYEIKSGALQPNYSNIDNQFDIIACKTTRYNEKLTISDNVVFEVIIDLDNKAERLELKLFENEILGITGLDGSNYEHLSEKILSSINKKKADNSKVFEIGKEYAYLGKNRETDWVFPLQSIDFNLSITDKRVLLLKNNNAVYKLIKELGISPEDPFKIVDELSGGNKLKTAIGRTLSLKCPVNIFDEPFTGIDPNAKIMIKEIIKTNVRIRKSSFIIFSKDYFDMLGFCDRILAIKNNGEYEIFEGSYLMSVQNLNIEEELFG